MRKLLLATVAALGASMGAAAYADAQVVDNTYSAQAYPNSSSSTDGQAFPTPGTITVRLNGRFRFYAIGMNQGAARTSNFSTGAAQGNAAAGNITTTTSNQGINKLANYSIVEYARLYPGFDGVAANGLKYGASLEVRQDNNFGAGSGFSGSVTGLTRNSGLLYLRREWGYLGSDRFGQLRLGASDQPGSLYLTGTFENFDAGGINGDIPDGLPGNLQLAWPLEDVGNMYATNKIVYLSPSFYGVDGGVSFEPSTAEVGNNNSGDCGPTATIGQFSSAGNSVATPGCAALSSTSTSDYTRRRNTYEGLIRYRGTFGPVGIAATAEYIGSGRVLDSGIVGSTTNPKRFPLEDLSVGDFGLAVTFGGLTVGGNYQFGRYNVQGGGSPAGLIAKGQPDSSAIVTGASYTIGPVIFGVQYVRSFSEGDQTTATNKNGIGTPVTPSSTTVLGGQRLEQGVGIGGTYSLAPGVAIFVSGVWEQRRQSGYNFITGASNNPLNNKVSASVYGIGTAFAW